MDRQITYPKFQVIDAYGNPLSGGKIYTYDVGGTTPKTTYTTRALTAGTENANPVILDSRGECLIFCSGTIKLVIKTSSDADVITVDALKVSDVNLLSDSDGDTYVSVEKNADEDIVRIWTAGSQRAQADVNGLTLASGASVNEFSTDGTLAGDSDDAVPTEKAVKTYVDSSTAIQSVNYLLAGLFQRPIVGYNGGVTPFTITVGSSGLWCADKFCYWTSTLTTGAIGTPAANTWYYLYLDYANIVSGVPIIASKLIWSATAPSWNSTYNGWYNGSNRCIGAALTNAGNTNILEFFHDGGDLVAWADSITVATNLVPGASWTDINLITPIPAVPGFSTKTRCLFISQYIDSAGLNAYYKTKGQTGTTGRHIAQVYTTGIYSVLEMVVFTDGSQVIQVKWDGATANTITAKVNGFYLPTGM